MSDKEAQPAIGGDLQEAITKFEKGKLNTCETKDKTILPDQATIEQEKKAAQEEASGKWDAFLICAVHSTSIAF